MQEGGGKEYAAPLQPMLVGPQPTVGNNDTL